MEEKKEAPVGEVIKLTPFESQISELEELVKDYNNLVVTKENYKQMDEKRLVLYRKRIAIQRDEKANTDALNKAKKLNSSKADTLIAIIKPKEDDLANKLKAIDDAIELAKQAELKRVNDHRNIINSFGAKLIEVMKITDLEVLEEKRSACEKWHKEYKAEEFQGELDGVVQSYTDTIDGLVKILKSKKVVEPEAVDFGEEPATEPTPEVKEIPRMFKDHPRPEGFELPGQIPASQRPAFGGSTERVVLGNNNSDIKPVPEPTLEERAKSGEFMSQVAANLVYGGYRFYIDTRLSIAHKNQIEDYLKGVVDSVNANEEAF
jgi:hypothetical protein